LFAYTWHKLFYFLLLTASSITWVIESIALFEKWLVIEMSVALKTHFQPAGKEMKRKRVKKENTRRTLKTPERSAKPRHVIDVRLQLCNEI
jgi:hypothetical protein